MRFHFEDSNGIAGNDEEKLADATASMDKSGKLALADFEKLYECNGHAHDDMLEAYQEYNEFHAHSLADSNGLAVSDEEPPDDATASHHKSDKLDLVAFEKLYEGNDHHAHYPEDPPDHVVSDEECFDTVDEEVFANSSAVEAGHTAIFPGGCPA